MCTATRKRNLPQFSDTPSKGLTMAHFVSCSAKAWRSHLRIA